jgi:hypothetical protein
MPKRLILGGGLLAAVAAAIFAWFRAQKGDLTSPWSIPADDAPGRGWDEVDARRQTEEPAFAAGSTLGAPDPWSSPSA